MGLVLLPQHLTFVPMTPVSTERDRTDTHVGGHEILNAGGQEPERWRP
jgi:hypothetical protein